MPKFYLNRRPGANDQVYITRNQTPSSIASYQGDYHRANRALAKYAVLSGDPADYGMARCTLNEAESAFREYNIDTGGVSPLALALVLAVIIAVSCEVVYTLATGALDGPFAFLNGVAS